LKTAQLPKLKSKDLLVIGSAFIIWTACVFFGMQSMMKFDFESQLSSRPPEKFPLTIKENNLPVLYLILHPRCPCSSVSLDAFSQILLRTEGKVRASIFFVKPNSKLPQNWMQSDLWKKAQALKGVEVSIDDGGKIAKTFDAQTSGQVLLYDNDGKLRYAGGLNEARGQKASGLIEDKIVWLIENKFNLQSGTSARTSPALGCPLHDNQNTKACSPAQALESIQ
jgi:hypothetical protein